MTTTIQVTHEFKEYLTSLKKSKKETYQNVLEKALKKAHPEVLTPQEELMKEGCLVMNEENLKIAKEWESTLMDGLEYEEWN